MVRIIIIQTLFDLKRNMKYDQLFFSSQYFMASLASLNNSKRTNLPTLFSPSLDIENQIGLFFSQCETPFMIIDHR